MKKNNNLIIIYIIFLIILGVSVTGFMIGLFYNSEKVDLFKEFNSKETNIILDDSYELSDFEKINVSAKNSSIKVRYSNDNKVRVVIYGVNSSDAISKIDSGNLNISKYSNREFCVGFCISNDKDIIIYLPSNIKSSLNINSSSGDINIDDFKNLDVNVDVKSGDVKIKGALKSNIVTLSGDVDILSVNDSIIKTVSGDIEVKNVIGKIDYSTKSGDIEIDRFDILENSVINTLSGSIEVSNIGNCYVNAKSISGDVNVKASDRFSKIGLVINTSSGDIDIR